MVIKIKAKHVNIISLREEYYKSANISKASKLIAKDYSFGSAMRYLLFLWFRNDALIVII